MGEENELYNGLGAKAVQEAIDERDRLRAEVAELRHALDEARQELCDKAAITAERDLYLQQLEIFWSEAIADMDKNGVDFGEIVDATRRIVYVMRFTPSSGSGLELDE